MYTNTELSLNAVDSPIYESPLEKIQYSNDDFQLLIEEYTNNYIRVWKDCNSQIPALGKIFSNSEKRKQEKDILKFFEAIKTETTKNGFDEKASLRNYDKYSDAIKTFLMNGFNFSSVEIDILFNHNFLKVTSQFFEAARNYDSHLSVEDIYQAYRNVWAMNWIQLVLGKPIELTPSVFAYSLLYPYTDNFIDDPKISKEQKIAFNNRLTRRLKGEIIQPESPHEQIIYDLVGMIESQYDRKKFPGVFESLLGIQNAQVKSMRLLNSETDITDEELLSTSLEKGGTSVLADGYLVAGNITEKQKIFLYGYGAYLQLVDDLQDVPEDLKSRQLTIYSREAFHNKLDQMINQTYNFGERVLSLSDQFRINNRENIFELMKKSSNLLLIVAVGLTNNLYSSPYVSKIESHSPFRFKFLRSNHKSFFYYGMLLMKLSNRG